MDAATPAKLDQKSEQTQTENNFGQYMGKWDKEHKVRHATDQEQDKTKKLQETVHMPKK